MYRLIFDTVKDLSPNLQVIITDHANSKIKDFQESIVEEWRKGKKLIPKDWYE